MPLFSYRAINDDNKEVRGTIDALDPEGAKQALEDLHLEIVDIAEATRIRPPVPTPTTSLPVQQPVSRTTFAFEGTDQHGHTQRGTIQAENKHEAFDRLKQEQALYLTALSPVGITPPYRDYDLLNWQRKEAAPLPKMPPVSAPPVPSAAKSKIGFTMPAGTLTPPQVQGVKAPATVSAPRYYPLVSTLRLYAGWLLAWYGLFVALGFYTHVRTLPWYIPFVEGFYLSPLIFSFVVAIFLFLLLTSVHRALRGGLFFGVILIMIGIAGFVGVRGSV
jgi:hypothetical protein